MFKWVLCISAILMTTVTCSELETVQGHTHSNEEKAESTTRMRRSGESEAERQMVTIDLSALRPSLPGLILYKYGDLAPKLVQIDLASLNPQLQPHVIWPQFDQLELGDERSFDLDNMDAIPYLTEMTPLLSPRPQRLSARPDWSEMDDIADGDIYDFIPDSLRNEELMTLHRSLPLADEVIVPLDWEEDKASFTSAASKRNVFVSKGWKPGGQKERESERAAADKTFKFSKGRRYQDNVMYTPFGLDSWRPGKRRQFYQRKETETEGSENQDGIIGLKNNPDKKNVFVSKGWGPGGRSLSTGGIGNSGSSQRSNNGRGRHGRNLNGPSARISSQESWAVPRRYWNVPHLFGVHFQ